MAKVDKYELIRKIATGGMAEVFLAKAAGPMGFERTLVALWRAIERAAKRMLQSDPADASELVAGRR